MIRRAVWRGVASRRAPRSPSRSPYGSRRAGAVAACTALVCLAAPGCMAPQMMLLKSGLDSLRTVVDTLVVRDSIAYAVLAETRREVAEQRDILLSTRATTGSTTEELFGQMERLEVKLDEVMGRFQQFSERRAAPPSGPGADPNTLYDQAAQDLTQGRYDLALQGFRDFVTYFPTSDLADNAQYGIGECFFAQAQFDSASSAYEQVATLYPQGDKVPAALFKLALSQEKEGKDGDSKKTMEDLVELFPNSGEAQLARERLGTSRRR